MSVKIVAAKVHQEQLKDAEIQREMREIEEQLNKAALTYVENTLNFVFVQGIYQHNERKMLTVCLFVNKMDKPITEIHGVLRLKFRNKDAMIAKTKLDFDEPFMGTVQPGEALLIHLGIPVKGLSGDETFKVSDIQGSFEDVRVTTV